MKRKDFKTSTKISAWTWVGITILVWCLKYDLGTIATLGGIALMFAWMYEQANIED